MIKLAFCKSNTAISLAIRITTWSQWSHVAIIDGDEVIEAAPSGVRRCSISTLYAENDVVEVVNFRCANPEAIINAANSQVGKPYDFTAVIGIYFHRDWQSRDRWYCAELVAWAFEQAKDPLFRSDALHRVTPQHLWMLSPNRLLNA